MSTSEQEPSSVDRFLLYALAVEATIACAALFVSRLLDHDPFVGIDLENGPARDWLRAISLGIIATLPPLGGFVILDRVPWIGFQRIKEFMETQFLPNFRQATWAEVAMIALAAGLGEELLFRGLIQQSLAAWFDSAQGTMLVVIAAAVIFGLCHWITPTYAALATGMGIYFGVLLVLSGSIIVPILCHALYDFVVLVILIRRQEKTAAR